MGATITEFLIKYREISESFREKEMLDRLKEFNLKYLL